MKLRKYLKDNHLTISGFARDAGISRTSLLRILKGADCYLTVALKIYWATEGKVTLLELWPERARSKLTVLDELDTSDDICDCV